MDTEADAASHCVTIHDSDIRFTVGSYELVELVFRGEECLGHFRDESFMKRANVATSAKGSPGTGNDYDIR